MWCCAWDRFFENDVLPQSRENRRNSGFFECIGKFFLNSLLFINLVYNESLYYCNYCMLEQILYLRKFWFLVYGPKCSWPMKLQDFSVNLRTLKLAVFYKGINEINWFLVCLSNSFLRNGSLGLFLIFGTMVDNANIEKLTETFFFQEKSFLTQIWAKRAQNATKIGFFKFFEKFCYVRFFFEVIYYEN